MNKTLLKLFFTNLFIILVSFFVFGVAVQISSLDFPAFLLTGFFLAIILSLAAGGIFSRPLTQIKKSVAQHLTQMSRELEHKTTALKEDQNELQTILSSMIEGVIVVDQDERIILINNPVYEMLDLRSQNTIGKPYWEIIRNAEINSFLKEAIHFKKSLKKEITIIAPTESHFSMQISCVLMDSGALCAVVAVFHDISELKKMERMRSEFVANASHELKTPLTTIKGFVETLKEGALNDPSRAMQFLQIIDKHTSRLEQLVNDLLNLSAIESKEINLKFEHVSIATVIETTVSFCKENIEKGKHKITVTIEENLPAVFIDRHQIEQAFFNLLDNAIKFTPPGGVISISAKKENDLIRVDVKDSGVGIDAAHLPRIFERFYRVDKGRSREMGGTGLGLSIVKHIILAHHGKVSVSSELGKGSTFSVFLPFRTPPTPSFNSPSPPLYLPVGRQVKEGEWGS